MLELDESITDGLIREVDEETGLHVRAAALTGVYKNMRRGIVALVFRCDVLAGGRRRPTKRASSHGSHPDELADCMTDAYSVRLLDALDHDAMPTVRAHDGRSLVI